jgi:hypothetical protein
MMLVKADGTVVPLGTENLVYGPPVDPDYAVQIRLAVEKKFKEREASGELTQGQLWSMLGHQVIGSEVFPDAR